MENVGAIFYRQSLLLSDPKTASWPSLKRIAENLDTVLLRADLGACDIAWSLKEDKTKGITGAISQQRDLLMLLENEFQEVLTF